MQQQQAFTKLLPEVGDAVCGQVLFCVESVQWAGLKCIPLRLELTKLVNMDTISWAFGKTVGRSEPDQCQLPRNEASLWDVTKPKTNPWTKGFGQFWNHNFFFTDQRTCFVFPRSFFNVYSFFCFLASLRMKCHSDINYLMIRINRLNDTKIPQRGGMLCNATS